MLIQQWVECSYYVLLALQIIEKVESNQHRISIMDSPPSNPSHQDSSRLARTQGVSHSTNKKFSGERFNRGTRLSSSKKPVQASSFQNNSSKKLLVLKNSRALAKQDDKPVYEFESVKWIPIISAYDPERLKNITVKKESYQEFFGKHNPKNDPLGQLYIQSIISHFNQWRKKINRKYVRVIDYFVNGRVGELDAIEEELESIKGMTQEMRAILKSILHKYQNYRIRKLVQGYELSLQQSMGFLSTIRVILDSRRKIEQQLVKLQSKKQLNKILRKLQKTKVQQTKELLHKHPNRFEQEIMAKVQIMIKQMIDMSQEAMQSVEDMKEIINRIKNVLEYRDDEMGLKGLERINRIFQQVLDQARNVRESSEQIQQNGFFTAQFKAKIGKYQREMDEKKHLAVKSLLVIIQSIVSSLTDTFKQYYSINQPFVRGQEDFQNVRKGLISIANNLKKQGQPQARVISTFARSITQNLNRLRDHKARLEAIRAKDNILFDQNFKTNLNQLIQQNAQYKGNVRELITKFMDVQGELGMNTSGREQIPELDVETEYLKSLQKCSAYFQRNSLEELNVFKPLHLSIFETAKAKEFGDIAEKQASKVQQILTNYLVLKKLMQNNQVREVLGELKLRSKLLPNVESISKVLTHCLEISDQNLLTQVPLAKSSLKSTVELDYRIPVMYQNIVLSRLGGVIKTQSITDAKTAISKAIEQKTDYTSELKLCQQKRAVLLLLSSGMNPAEDIQILRQISQAIAEYDYLQKIHDTLHLIERKDNLLYPNEQFVVDLLTRAFTWMLINKSQEPRKLTSLIRIKCDIMKTQSVRMAQLKLTRVYQEQPTLKKYIDSYVDLSSDLLRSLKEFKDRILVTQDRVQLLEDYMTFCNNSIYYLHNTKQTYFCFLTSKNQPFFVTRVINNHSNSLIQDFTKAVGLPYSKQLISKLQTECKPLPNYVPVKRSVKSKAQTPKKEEQLEECVQEEQEDMIQEIAEQELPEEDQIADEIVEEDSVSLKIKQAKQVVSKKAIHRTRPIAVKISKINTLSTLYHSVERCESWHSQCCKIVSGQLYCQLINHYFLSRILHKKDYSDGKLLSKCKQNLGSIRRCLQTNIKDNVLKDFMQVDKRYKQLNTVLGQLQNKLGSFSDRNFYQTSQGIIQLFQLASLAHNVILDEQRRAVYLTLQQMGDQKRELLSKTLGYMECKFSEQDINVMVSQYFLQADGATILQHYGQLQYQHNNLQYSTAKEMLGFDNYPTLYKSVDPDQLIGAMWLQFAEPSDQNYQNLQELALKFKQSIVSVNSSYIKSKINNLNQSAVRFCTSLKHDIAAYLEKIRLKEQQLIIKVNHQIKFGDVDRVCRQISTAQLLSAKHWKLLQEISTNQIFFITIENSPEDIVSQLWELLLPEIDQKHIASLTPTISGKTYTYNYQQILNSLRPSLTFHRKQVLALQEDLYQLVNRKFNQPEKDWREQKITQLCAKSDQYLTKLLKHPLMSCQQLAEFKHEIQQSKGWNSSICQVVNAINTSQLTNRKSYQQMVDYLASSDTIDSPMCIFYTHDNQFMEMLKGSNRVQAINDFTRSIHRPSPLLREQLKLSQERVGKHYKYKMDRQHILVKYMGNLKNVNKYIGNITATIGCAGKNNLYAGPLLQQMEIQYQFPSMMGIIITLSSQGTQLAKDTVEEARLDDRIITKEGERVLTEMVDAKIEEQELERIRLENEKRERQKRQYEERERLRRLKQEEEQRARKAEQEEKRRRQQEQQKRKQEQRRQQQQRRIKLEEQARLKKQKQAEQQRQRKQQEERKQKQLIKLQEEKLLKEAIRKSTEEEQTIRAVVAEQMDGFQQKLLSGNVSKSKKVFSSAESIQIPSSKWESQFEGYQIQLQKFGKADAVKFKRPSAIIEERKQVPQYSEVLEEEEFEESITLSQGYTHEQVRHAPNDQYDFLGKIKEKQALEKYQRLKRKV